MCGVCIKMYGTQIGTEVDGSQNLRFQESIKSIEELCFMQNETMSSFLSLPCVFKQL